MHRCWRWHWRSCDHVHKLKLSCQTFCSHLVVPIMSPHLSIKEKIKVSIQWWCCTPETGVWCHTPETGVQHHTPEMGVWCYTPGMGVQHHTPELGVCYTPETGMQHHTPELGVWRYTPETGVQHHTPELGVWHYIPEIGVQRHTPEMGVHPWSSCMLPIVPPPPPHPSWDLGPHQYCSETTLNKSNKWTMSGKVWGMIDIECCTQNCQCITIGKAL